MTFPPISWFSSPWGQEPKAALKAKEEIRNPWRCFPVLAVGQKEATALPLPPCLPWALQGLAGHSFPAATAKNRPVTSHFLLLNVYRLCWVVACFCQVFESMFKNSFLSLKKFFFFFTVSIVSPTKATYLANLNQRGGNKAHVHWKNS